MSFRIRDASFPDDRSAALSFIMALQHYEGGFEPDRRLDPAMADDYFAVLMRRVATKKGRIFIAEDNARAIGWAAFLVEENPSSSARKSAPTAISASSS